MKPTEDEIEEIRADCIKPYTCVWVEWVKGRTRLVSVGQLVKFTRTQLLLRQTEIVHKIPTKYIKGKAGGDTLKIPTKSVKSIIKYSSMWYVYE